MEKMELNLFNNIYKNKRVLVTGNTGFKGSWLTLWLKEMGAQVFGISLPPDTEPNHWNLSKINCRNFFQDIRNFEMTSKIMDEVQPEIIFHLAAQTLVRKSYKNVLETWSTNVMGTANLLEICKKIPTIRAMVVVTTDKVYENKEWLWGYRENDALGGYDSYSASKAATELVVSSFRKSFFQNGPLVATARAGNVIGGGDWAEDRLIPDLIRAISKNEILEIRSPKSTRPWQHVLDCLSGYLLL
jgi:CDP-glucose 4,6-dehydratase